MKRFFTLFLAIAMVIALFGAPDVQAGAIEDLLANSQGISLGRNPIFKNSFLLQAGDGLGAKIYVSQVSLPALSSGSLGGVVAGSTDVRMALTAPITGTTMTVSFGSPWANKPFCQATNNTRNSSVAVTMGGSWDNATSKFTSWTSFNLVVGGSTGWITSDEVVVTCGSWRS